MAVSLGPGRASAALVGSSAVPEGVALVPPLTSPVPHGPGEADESTIREGLTKALGDLRSRLERTHDRPLEAASVAVAVLPPLAEVRLVELPPLGRNETEAVIRRDVSRYFVGSVASRTIGVAGPAGRRGASEGAQPVLAAAIATELAEAIRSAVEGVGWRLRKIAPAQAAWLKAALAMPDVDGVLALYDGTVHAFGVGGGEVRSLRRIPFEALDELMEDPGGGLGSRIAVIGSDADVAAVRETFGAGGGSELVTPPEGTAPLALAARCAHDVDLEIVPPTAAADRTRRTRLSALRLAGAALLVLLLAAATHVWGIQRELEALRDRREEIRTQVTPVLAMRDSIRRVDREAEALAELEDRAHRWTPALADLALLLPREAYVTSLTGSEGLLEVEAAGQWAGEALQALQLAESLEDVSIAGQVERELENGETVVERFTVRAELAGASEPTDSVSGEGR